MGGINVSRWIMAGIAAGVVVWLLEGAASVLYMADMTEALEARGIVLEMSAGILVASVFVSVITGLALMFFYAAARPRFGPGPGTAALVAVVFWAGGYVMSLIGYGMLGLYPTRMLVMWAVIGLVEMIIAAIVGAWIYREDARSPAAVPA
jgi:hypothetical protein